MRAATMPAASAASESGPAMTRALGWLARLVLLTEAQLGALLGLDEDEWQVRGLLGALGRERLVGSVIVDSPEFPEALRLYHLTDAGVRTVAGHMGVSVADLADRLPVRLEEFLARLARVETALGVADALAMLADAAHGSDPGGSATVTLVDAGGTHWAPHRGRAAVSLPGIEAWVRLRAGSLRATALLAWDRAGAPRGHRRERVTAWYRADEGRDARWGTSLPPLLVVCPDDRLADQWGSLFDGSAARRGRDLLRAAITTWPELANRGPLAPIWRRPSRCSRADLAELLVWEGETALHAQPDVVRGVSHLPRRQDQPLFGNATAGLAGTMQVMGSRVGAGRSDTAVRRASLAVDLSATQKILLGWIARHPLLVAGHLATLMELSERAVTALLDGLVRRELIIVESALVLGERVGPRYVLARRGADYLAVREGVPLHRYLSDGAIAAAGLSIDSDTAGAGSTAVRLADVRRHPEHTAGVQEFAMALAREAAARRGRSEDHALLAWLNPTEAHEQFTRCGQIQHIWPDARFHYRAHGVVYDLLLEWDRGLVRRRDYARKFAAYAAYFTRAGRRTDQAERIPRLLVVTTGSALARIRDEIHKAAGRSPGLLDVTRLLTHHSVEAREVTGAFAEDQPSGYRTPVQFDATKMPGNARYGGPLRCAPLGS